MFVFFDRLLGFQRFTLSLLKCMLLSDALFTLGPNFDCLEGNHLFEVHSSGVLGCVDVCRVDGMRVKIYV